MPTLNWIGKDAVLDHHRQVPYHFLRCDEKLSVGDPGSGNLLVQSDNLLASRIMGELHAHDGPKVICGEGSRGGPTRLQREGITFKQVPCEIEVS